MKQSHLIQISPDRCIGCRACIQDCPVNNLALKDGKAVVKAQDCILCGHCVAICPKNALSITGFDEPPVEISKPISLDPNQLLDAIRSRRSIRRFKETPIAPEVIAQIIRAGQFTPSAKNAQDVSYLVLQNELRHCEEIGVKFIKTILPMVKLVSKSARTAEIDEHFFFKKAPAAIVVVSKDKISASLAASNMALMAEANGLGVLYSGFFAMAANYCGALRGLLKIKNGKAVTVLVLGYPNVRYHRTAQKESPVVAYR